MRAARLLIACALALCISGEFGVRALQRRSAFYTRVERESEAAVRIRPASTNPAGARALFFAGNSLLEYAVDVPQLNRALQPRFHASRFVLEGSSFYDWYYGLGSLFDRGMRPHAVLLCLNLPFLVDPAPPDQLSAYLLLDVPNIARLSRALHPGASVSAGLFAAHFSALLGAGPEMRRVLLERLIPSRGYWDALTPASARPASALASERLLAVQSLCAAHGAAFYLLIPPSLAATAAPHAPGVRILSPRPLDPDPSHYRDGYHLSEAGARPFTAALAHDLLRSL